MRARREVDPPPVRRQASMVPLGKAEIGRQPNRRRRAGKPDWRACLGVGNGREQIAAQSLPKQIQTLPKDFAQRSGSMSRYSSSSAQKAGATASTKRPSVTTSSVAAWCTSQSMSRIGRTEAVMSTRTPGCLPASHASSISASRPPRQSSKSGRRKSPSPSRRESIPPAIAASAKASAAPRSDPSGDGRCAWGGSRRCQGKSQ